MTGTETLRTRPRCGAQSLPIDPTTRTSVASAAAAAPAASLIFAALVLAAYLWSRWQNARTRRTPAPAFGGGAGGGCELVGFRGQTYEVDHADADACAAFLAQCAQRVREHTLNCFVEATVDLSFKEGPSSRPPAPCSCISSGPAVFNSAPTSERPLV
jgi:hypothetical protein